MMASKLSIEDTMFLDCTVQQRAPYKCPECKHLLNNAVQISCGHWLCRECATSIHNLSSTPVCPCPECHEDLEENEAFPDKCVQKEINSLHVKCCFDKCPWTGVLQDYSIHITECESRNQLTEEISSKDVNFDYETSDSQVEPAAMKCPYIEYGCETTKEMSKEELKEHLVNNCSAHVHQMQDNSIDLLQTPLASNDDSITKGNDSVLKDIAKSDGDLLEMYIPHVDFNSLQKGQPSLEDDSRLKAFLQGNTLFVVPSGSCPPAENEFEWKVSHFSQRKNDATTGKCPSIFSLPFYSGCYGYKMCLRLYILGDGIGKGSHVSLFFVIMKGEFDNILQWPFNHKITFKLINQCGGRDVVDVFQPDLLSSNFHQPKTDMNIASGCPRFISLNELVQNGFIIDDTIFIKVKVGESGFINNETSKQDIDLPLSKNAMV